MATSNLIKRTLFDDTVNIKSFNYGAILQNIANFRRSNGKSKTDAIKFDAPQTYYFKLFFFFDDDSTSGANISESGIPTSNFLGRTYDGQLFTGLPWEGGELKQYEYSQRTSHNPVNTALNYLLINYEWDRARKLTEFITLLSEISYKYPWYFQTISGLDEALTRKEVTDKEFKLDEDRKKIQIKCLQDAEDNKIGRLLDLYRNIVWSQLMKKEIVPANLRKFDMGLFIFSRPIKNMHRKVSKNSFLEQDESQYWDTPKDQNDTSKKEGTTSIYADFLPELDPITANKDIDRFKASYKYIEFHNCEFDYNSSASGYNDLNNAEGFKQEYTINILFDDVYENRYDSQFVENIGDFTLWDLNLSSEETEDEASWWNAIQQEEQIVRNIRSTEFKNREKLFSSSSNEEQKDTLSDTKNDITTSTGVGIRSSDLIANGSKTKIVSTRNPNGEFWKGTLTKNDSGIFTNALRQVTDYAWRNYGNPAYRKFVLGNFYKVQFNKFKGGLKAAEKGDVFGAVKKFKSFSNGWKKK